MSVLGRNSVWGAQVTFYRPTTAPDTGGQSATTWAETLGAKLELYGLTDEQRREIFGIDSTAKMAAFMDDSANVELKDGCVVQSGPRTGMKLRVVNKTTSRRYLEIGFESTDETIP
jgi:hypothetical protein